jgi:hypothetical protein
MKKILLFSIASFSAISMFAQQKNKSIMSVQKTETESIGKRTAPVMPNHTKSKTRAASRWFDVVDAKDKTTGTIFSDFANTVNTGLIWHDSTMKALYGNGAGGTVQSAIWLKGIGQVIDPAATDFNSTSNYPGEIAFTRGKGYTVDSVGVIGIYDRNPSKPNVVDTLIVSVANNSDIFTWNERQAVVVSNYNTDTIKIADPAFNFSKNAIDGTSTIIKKIPLTAASVNDTISGGWNYYETPVGVTVGAAGINVAAVSVVFKSGDTWTPLVDSIGSGTNVIYNRFRFVSFEEASGTFREYTKGDYNMSSIMQNDTTGWGDLFIPSFYYTGADFGYEHHWLQWKLTCPTCAATVGINENEISFGKVSVFPNPATETANFSIYLENTAKEVTIEISNALGQVVKTTKVGSVAANSTSNTTISVADLSAGMYIYTINADGQKTSNKLMVK